MRSLADVVRKALTNRTRRLLDFETASLGGAAQVAVMDSVTPPKESIFKVDGVLVSLTPISAGDLGMVRGIIGQIRRPPGFSALWSRSRSLATSARHSDDTVIAIRLDLYNPRG